MDKYCHFTISNFYWFDEYLDGQTQEENEMEKMYKHDKLFTVASSYSHCMRTTILKPYTR